MRARVALSASSETHKLVPNVMLLSPRVWLAQWPRRLQLFAVALLLLGTLAQSWHVCALSGHAMAGDASSHGGGHGAKKSKKFKVIANADGTPGPVICVCDHEDSPPGAAFAARPDAHEHATCLALLLQTMPLQAGVPFTLVWAETPRSIYAPRAEIASARAALLSRRGRSPPLDC